MYSCVCESMMKHARTTKYWKRLDRFVAVIALSTALTSIAFAGETVVVVFLGVAVPLLAALLLAARRTRMERMPRSQPAVDAVWPRPEDLTRKQTVEEAVESDRGTADDRRSVGEKLDEIEERFRRGEISEDERLALRDDIITLKR